MFDRQYHTHHHQSFGLQGEEVKALLAELKLQNDLIITSLETIMATKQEVQDDIADIKATVADTRGAANSAITLLNEVLARVGESAASAADLDAFRADLALIKSETLAEKADLMAAVNKNPGQPAPPA